MPIYEYQCSKCSHHLEALQKISDKPLRECPECGRHTLIRLVSAPLFRLSGSGWYETDFKSDKESKRNLADKGERDAPKSEEKPDTKPESKPESKVEAKPAAEPRKRTMVTKSAVKAPARSKAKAAPRKTPRGRHR